VPDACELLGLKRRKVFRLLAGLKHGGAASLISKRCGRPSNARLREAYRDLAMLSQVEYAKAAMAPAGVNLDLGPSHCRWPAEFRRRENRRNRLPYSALADGRNGVTIRDGNFPAHVPVLHRRIPCSSVSIPCSTTREFSGKALVFKAESVQSNDKSGKFRYSGADGTKNGPETEGASLVPSPVISWPREYTQATAMDHPTRSRAIARWCYVLAVAP
jgi:Winged helix-turn helix